VPAGDRSKIEGLIKDLRDAVAQEDDGRIQSLTTELQQSLYSVSANLYQQPGGPTGAAEPADGGADAGGQAPPNASGGSDDVIDAEFSETK
jgi:molecular chaperone DnaK